MGGGLTGCFVGQVGIQAPGRVAASERGVFSILQICGSLMSDAMQQVLCRLNEIAHTHKKKNRGEKLKQSQLLEWQSL